MPREGRAWFKLRDMHEGRGADGRDREGSVARGQGAGRAAWRRGNGLCHGEAAGPALRKGRDRRTGLDPDRGGGQGAAVPRPQGTAELNLRALSEFFQKSKYIFRRSQINPTRLKYKGGIYSSWILSRAAFDGTTRRARRPVRRTAL